MPVSITSLLSPWDQLIEEFYWYVHHPINPRRIRRNWLVGLSALMIYGVARTYYLGNSPLIVAIAIAPLLAIAWFYAPRFEWHVSNSGYRMQYGELVKTVEVDPEAGSITLTKRSKKYARDKTITWDMQSIFRIVSTPSYIVLYGPDSSEMLRRDESQEPGIANLVNLIRRANETCELLDESERTGLF